MSPEIFKRIADEVGKYNAWLRISGGGEPTLHPQFFELMKYAKDKGCKLGIITNGSKLDTELSRKLLEIDVDMHDRILDSMHKFRRKNPREKPLILFLSQKLYSRLMRETPTSQLPSAIPDAAYVYGMKVIVLQDTPEEFIYVK